MTENIINSAFFNSFFCKTFSECLRLFSLYPMNKGISYNYVGTSEISPNFQTKESHALHSLSIPSFLGFRRTAVVFAAIG